MKRLRVAVLFFAAALFCAPRAFAQWPTFDIPAFPEKISGILQKGNQTKSTIEGTIANNKVLTSIGSARSTMSKLADKADDARKKVEDAKGAVDDAKKQVNAVQSQVSQAASSAQNTYSQASSAVNSAQSQASQAASAASASVPSSSSASASAGASGSASFEPAAKPQIFVQDQEQAQTQTPAPASSSVRKQFAVVEDEGDGTVLEVPGEEVVEGKEDEEVKETAEPGKEGAGEAEAAVKPEELDKPLIAPAAVVEEEEEYLEEEEEEGTPENADGFVNGRFVVSSILLHEECGMTEDQLAEPSHMVRCLKQSLLCKLVDGSAKVAEDAARQFAAIGQDMASNYMGLSVEAQNDAVKYEEKVIGPARKDMAGSSNETDLLNNMGITDLDVAAKPLFEQASMNARVLALDSFRLMSAADKESLKEYCNR